MKLVGERRALAAAVMAFWFLNYVLLALSGELPELTAMLAAMGGVYGLAFFALVAGYFWARWYTVGVGLFGVILGSVLLWKIGWSPPVAIIGGSHLAATLLLWGDTMSGPYDGQTAWRERFHMDDNAVQRLGRSVIRAGVSLPFVMMYAFAPRDGASLAGFAALGLAALGLRGLVQLRTWGVVLVGASGMLLLALTGGELASDGLTINLANPLIPGALLIAAAAPFAGSMARWLTRRR